MLLALPERRRTSQPTDRFRSTIGSICKTVELAVGARKLTDGRGADVVLDVVGGPMFEQCLSALAWRGRQVAISSSPDPRVSFNLVDFYHNESRLVGVDSLKLSFAETGEILRHLSPCRVQNPGQAHFDSVTCVVAVSSLAASRFQFGKAALIIEIRRLGQRTPRLLYLRLYSCMPLTWNNRWEA